MNLLLQQIKGVLEILYGKDLRQLRKNAGMSQEELAHELHMSISNISRMETGKYEVRMSDMFRWINITQGQEVLAAAILSIDVGIMQKAIDIASTMMAGVITW